MAELENPYQPPTSRVADAPQPSIDSGNYIEGGRSVSAGRGWEWIKDGYGYFRRQAGMWMVLTVILFLLLVALQLVPLIGTLSFTLLMPIMIGGLMIGCRTVARGEELELAHLFAGFRRNSAQLMLIGVIGAVLTLLAMAPTLFVTGMSVIAGARGSTAAALAFGAGAILAGLISLALLIPINMALWFAPALVALQDQTATRAIQQSFRGCLRNIVAFLIYGVILFIFAMIASLPFGLGWLVLAPVVICSVYAAYRDVFFQR